MINLDKIIDKLMRFGLTKTESLTYVYFLKNGVSSGYKIAKELNLSRSTVYQAIDSLYNRGYLFLVPSQNKEYKAKDVNIMMEELEKEYIENTQYLKRELKQFESVEDTKYFYNIEGYQNIVTKAKELILKSNSELCINTDLDLKTFYQEIDEVIKRGVRVIIFSFAKQNTYGLDVELYYRSDEMLNPIINRFMMVSDSENVLIGVNVDNHHFVGNFSNNPIYAKIIAEHIHHDIYLAKLFQKFPGELEKEILIGSTHEAAAKAEMDEEKEIDETKID